MKKISLLLLICMVCFGACKKDNTTIVNIPQSTPKVYLDGVQDIVLNRRSTSSNANELTMVVVAHSADTMPRKITVTLVGESTGGLIVGAFLNPDYLGPWTGYSGFSVAITANANYSTVAATHYYILQVSDGRATTSYPFTVALR